MLYRQLLGADFDRLPRALRDFHDTPGGGRAVGTAAVRRTFGWLGWLAGFPRAGENVDLQLRVVADESSETWIRSFGGKDLRTVQRRVGDLLLESSGPVRIRFRVMADATGIRFASQGARFWFVPIPLRIEAREWGGDSSWQFEVTVAGVGSYSGRMVPTL